MAGWVWRIGLFLFFFSSGGNRDDNFFFVQNRLQRPTDFTRSKQVIGFGGQFQWVPCLFILSSLSPLVNLKKKMERKQTKQNKQKCSKLGTSPFDFQLTCCMRALSFGFNVISSFSFRKKKRLDLGLDHSYFFMFPWHWAIIGNSRDVVIIFFFASYLCDYVHLSPSRSRCFAFHNNLRSPFKPIFYRPDVTFLVSLCFVAYILCLSIVEGEKICSRFFLKYHFYKWVLVNENRNNNSKYAAEWRSSIYK